MEPSPSRRRQGDAIYVRYAQELDADKRKAIARELQDYMIDHMYWNNISGSPFYQSPRAG